MMFSLKPRRAGKYFLVPVFISVIVLLSIIKPLSGREHRWTGRWDTRWKNGGARIDMVQTGTHVTGKYPAVKGGFEGEVKDGVLTAWWAENKESGSLTFSMSSDGQSFSGRFDDGEWWSGRRMDRNGEPNPYDVFLIPNLGSPRDTLRSYLIASDFVDFGSNDFITTAMNCCILDEKSAALPVTKQIATVDAFFDTLDQATFRLWDVPGQTGFRLTGTPEEFSVKLLQAGTNESVTVSMVKRENQWKILVPPIAESKEKLATLLRARGIDQLVRSGHQEQTTPRDVMMNFFVNSRKNTPASHQALEELMDLSHIDPSIRSHEAIYFTEYLKSIFDRCGFILWQEIPNDPKSTAEYVHFHHPSGEIVIAPVKVAGGQTKWKFTSDTLLQLPDIYEDIISLPLVTGTAETSDKPLFMRIRDRLQVIEPSLVRRGFYLENWQWCGLALSLGLGYVFARLAARLTSLFVAWKYARAARQLSAERRKFFVFPLFVVYLTLLWNLGVDALGLPVRLHTAFEIITQTCLILGGAWASYNIVHLTGKYCFELAQHTKTTFDDIFVSLFSSLLKIIIVIGALVLLADTFQLPYQTVIAGIGIGGLAIAIAARDTLANFIASAVLLADRPFRRGDLVSVGGTVGTISHVGLRSTDIRTESDSLLVIPNAVLVNEKITNLAARRNRRFQIVVGVLQGTTLEQLHAFRSGVLAVIEAQPNGEKLDRYAGVWEFKDAAIEIKISCLIDAPNLQTEYDIRHDLLLGILGLVKDLGMELAFPLEKKSSV